jgi:hypothetical protein
VDVADMVAEAVALVVGVKDGCAPGDRVEDGVSVCDGVCDGEPVPVGVLDGVPVCVAVTVGRVATNHVWIGLPFQVYVVSTLRWPSIRIAVAPFMTAPSPPVVML